MELMKRIQEQINALEAKKFFLLETMAQEEYIRLLTEIKNLETGAGDGYVPEDYYAPERYYSKIEGIKNLRFTDNDGKKILVVKVLNRRGKDLIGHFREYYEIPGINGVWIWESANYSNEINY